MRYTRSLTKRIDRFSLFLFFGFMILGTGCGKVQDRPDNWVEEVQGEDVQPDYALLFNLDTVHSLYIAILPEDFALMESNLDEIMGGGFAPFGEGGFRPFGDAGMPLGDGQGPPGFMDPTAAIEVCATLSEGDTCEIDGTSGVCTAVMGEIVVCLPDDFAFMGDGMPPDMGDGMPAGGMDMMSEDPVYVPVTISYNGYTWNYVGMRYKGNSSLMTAIQSGNGKKPFRLNFDYYENDFPEIKNQKFYGFREMTFSSNWTDDSQIRETLATEILRDRGIAAARCAFYRVFVDVGEGDVYWGLYTMIEDPDDGAMLDAQFGRRGGNLYKPEGTGADWTSFSPEGFVKKNHVEEADYSDIIAAIDALHASREDAISWRTELERYFDVDLFLNWLAVNTTIQNWDSYGSMAHNYYLYGDPAEDGRLNWIPWDHNMSMAASMMGGGFPMMGGELPMQGDELPMEGGGFPMFGGNGSTDDASSVLHTNASDRWPLISILLSDEQYNARYREYLARSLEGVFALDRIEELMHRLHEMIRPYVVGPEGEIASHTTITSADAFLGAIDGENGLMAHIINRHEIVQKALVP